MENTSAAPRRQWVNDCKTVVTLDINTNLQRQCEWLPPTQLVGVSRDNGTFSCVSHKLDNSIWLYGHALSPP